MAKNNLSGIISIFGLVFGIFLAVIGIGLVQDLVITINAEAGACAPNPIPIVSYFQPEICGDVGADGKVTVTGVGVILLVSMLMFIFFVIFIMFMVFLIPPLSGNLPALLFFSIFFLSSFMLAYFIGVNVLEVFF
jgi:hypothetical protein